MKPNLEQNTYEGYRWIIERQINPSLGHIPLCDLEPIHIQEFYTYLSEAGRVDGKGGLSNRTIVYVSSVLKKALTKAAELDLLDKNPCTHIKPPRDKNKRQKKQNMKVLSADELRAFLEASQDHPDYPIIYLAAYTGMRQSEILGLRRKDILWKEKKINVEMTLHVNKNNQFEHRPRTKNKTSTRKIDITENVIRILKEHIRKQTTTINAFGKELLFTTPEGNPIDRRNLSGRFANLATKLGHKGFRFHDLRHTHATLLLASGMMINAVSERLGHSDVQTTLDIYGHVLPQTASIAALTFEKLLSEK